jgi:glycosyltransferase involved in cell wall biosynthesis
MGITYDFSYLIDADDDKVFYAKGNLSKKAAIVMKSFQRRMKDVKRADDYDIIFVQREAFMTGTTYFERAFSKSKAKLIFDFDDSIWLHNVSEANRYLNFLKNPQKTSSIIGLSDHVVAGNAYLADYAKQRNSSVSIIPTTIDTESYVPMEGSSERDQVTIGWSGSITTIQHFNLAESILKRLKAKYKERIAIKVIGDANYRNEALDVQGIAWSAASELDDLRSMDIGIMPLPDDEWAQGKCGLKGLQYMALGIPTIMSPVGVNKAIISDGQNGFLAAEDDTWFEKLSLLIDQPELRLRLGKAGRATVEDAFSVKANAAKYLQVFETVLST